ncbi:carbonic anhydrase [Thiovulum sp. ES]|nr:carbonic anhydrase [Thiovulum sp. ES]
MPSKLLDRNKIFVDTYFKENSNKLVELVEKGQNPKALFIGCADSRVIPNLITQTDPGDLFVIRNVGNFVAPYKPDEDYHSTAAGIEYGVTALDVSEVIICGHTQCGAIASLYQNLDDKPFIHTKKWLSLGENAKTSATKRLGESGDHEELLRLTEKLSVVSQIENLMSYPYVRERVEKGDLHIHGWMYDMTTGEIEYYDPDESQFKALIQDKQSE